MARSLYSLLLYLVTPLVWLRLLWRAGKQPEYLQHLGERYGFYAGSHRHPAGRPLIWLHAVSVGETRALEPLLTALLQTHPHHDIVLTHMTPTGRQAGSEIAARHAGRVRQAYLPYDLPDACGRFFRHFHPVLGLLMETELWPNLIASATAHGTPLALVNGRLSARSQRGYARFAPLIGPALAALRFVSAQTADDAQRLRSLGAKNVSVSGNLKFDVVPAAEKLALGALWRQTLGSRPVLIAASTREGEEALILAAIATAGIANLLLILVPRHPQRFTEVAALLEARAIAYCRRSDGGLPSAGTQVWLGDSMGEMAAYYAAADVALIGGSLLPFGGQNLIEAAACGCAVLVGPHTYNFAQAADDAIASGGARRIADAGAAAAITRKLFADAGQLQRMREAASAFSLAHRGATQRTMALIDAISLAETGR